MSFIKTVEIAENIVWPTSKLKRMCLGAVSITSTNSLEAIGKLKTWNDFKIAKQMLAISHLVHYNQISFVLYTLILEICNITMELCYTLTVLVSNVCQNHKNLFHPLKKLFSYDFYSKHFSEILMVKTADRKLTVFHTLGTFLNFIRWILIKVVGNVPILL